MRIILLGKNWLYRYVWRKAQTTNLKVAKNNKHKSDSIIEGGGALSGA